MASLIKIDGEYANWIKDLSLRFRQSQIKAAIRVNSEMLRFYFSLGADIVNKKAESRWGDGFFKNLSRDLQNELPGVRGFSETNLRYAHIFIYYIIKHLQFIPGMNLIFLKSLGVITNTSSTSVKKILTKLFSM